MKWEGLLQMLGGEVLIHSSLLLTGKESAASVRRQLARWVASGRLLRLRRSLYAIASPYRTRVVHPFAVANRLKPASYVSLQSALGHYGLIPEHVPVVTCITTGRPETLETPMGAFSYRHVSLRLFFGYRVADLGGGFSAFLASPEKALLDLVHLSPGGDSLAYLEELRLQNLERLDTKQLVEFADRSDSAKLRRAGRRLAELIGREPSG
jgi:predicted transcriptional regulator of viral defense system